ncbi:BUD22-domain-containing protein [Mycena polygramma]|nr:BUD22-domain-containing protein [Mycena polygramma]
MDSTPSSTAPRGTKRKRPEPPAEVPSPIVLTRLVSNISRRIPPPSSLASLHVSPAIQTSHHELKEVRKAAKKARTFETQRVVKKLKGVRKKDPAASEIAILEAELEELKTIDSDAIADTALRTRLLKDRHIADSVPARAAMARELPPPTTPPIPNTSKVHTRLLSARALGAAVTQAVSGLRAVLLPPVAAGAVDVDVAMDAEEDGEEEEEEEDGNAGEEEEGGDADAAGWESGSVDGGNDSGEDEDQDEDGWESGSVHSDAPPPAKKSATTKAAKATPAPAKTKTKEAPTSASQFLPSLAVGFVRGGSSDSDFNEDDDGVEEEGPKKNRRGQRARRAIWEKKYGRGANHKKKEAEAVAKARAEQKALFEARQAKRAAAAEDSTFRPGRGGKWSEGAQVADRGWGARGTQTQTQPHVQQQRTGTGGGARAQGKPDAGLHPSWAAKKAMKEKMGSGIVPSQGTKIVFT